jgi:hypothetical protein
MHDGAAKTAIVAAYRVTKTTLICSGARKRQWREDNWRTSNDEQVRRITGLAMTNKPSIDFSGYWQRHRSTPPFRL